MKASSFHPDAKRASPLIRLVVGFISVLAAVVIAQVLITALPVSKLLQNILLGLITPPVAIGTYYAFARFVERREPSELEPKAAAREVTLGVVMGALLFGALMAILAVLGSLSVTGSNDWSVLLVPFIGSVTSAFFEEILFRGVVFRILEEAVGSWLGLGISGLLFGGLHLINPNSTLLGAVAVMLEAGILLAACVMLTRRLWLAIGLHFAWNFMQSGVFGLAVSGNAARQGILQSSLSGPVWLTGGGFGPEASVVAVVLSLALSTWMITRAIAKGNLVKGLWIRVREQAAH